MRGRRYSAHAHRINAAADRSEQFPPECNTASELGVTSHVDAISIQRQRSFIFLVHKLLEGLGCVAVFFAGEELKMLGWLNA